MTEEEREEIRELIRSELAEILSGALMLQENPLVTTPLWALEAELRR